MLWEKFKKAISRRQKDKTSLGKKESETIEGELVEYLSHCFTLDWDFYFYRLRSKDGKEIDVVLLDGDKWNVGSRIQARIVTPQVFKGNYVSLTDIKDVTKGSPPASRPRP